MQSKNGSPRKALEGLGRGSRGPGKGLNRGLRRCPKWGPGSMKKAPKGTPGGPGKGPPKKAQGSTEKLKEEQTARSSNGHRYPDAPAKGGEMVGHRPQRSDALMGKPVGQHQGRGDIWTYISMDIQRYVCIGFPHKDFIRHRLFGADAQKGNEDGTK
jgi:hypothetical protein